VEGALEWRMVSTTSVERPKLMSWVPSPSPMFPQFWVGVKDQPTGLREKVPPEQNLERRAVEETL